MSAQQAIGRLNLTQFQKAKSALLGAAMATLLALLHISPSALADTGRGSLTGPSVSSVESGQSAAGTLKTAAEPCTKITVHGEERPDCSGQTSPAAHSARSRERPRGAVTLTRAPPDTTVAWQAGRTTSDVFSRPPSGMQRARDPASTTSRSPFWAMFARLPKLRL